MVIAASFTILEIWKHPECPSKDEWIKKLVTKLCLILYDPMDYSTSDFLILHRSWLKLMSYESKSKMAQDLKLGFEILWLILHKALLMSLFLRL